MANPASVALRGNATNGELVKSTGTSAAITLDPQRKYAVTHLGLASDGTTAATGRIVFRSAATPTTAITEGVSHWVLLSGFAMPIIIGPGITTLNFISADADVIFNIFPINTQFENY